MNERVAEATPFAGRGDMAGRMRGLDWAAFGWGLPERWPASLRTACRIALTSRFPMIVWWGPDLRFFYNDDYAPLLGDKHPDALGAPGAEVWGEIWHLVGPMLRGVLETGDATWSADVLLPMDRHGYREETYWTFSYSPLHGDDGSVGGVFTAVTDTTQRVVGERRLVALQDLGAQAGRARTLDQACGLVLDALGRADADVPFASLHLLGPDGFAAPAGVDPVLRPDGPGAWPLREALADGTGVELDDVRERFETLPAGSWGHPPNQAVLLPLRGETGAAPLGVAVLGVNAGRALDEPYRRFLTLVAAQASALLNGAIAYQAQQERAEERIQAGRMQARYEPVEAGRLTGELAGVFRAAVERAGLEFRVDCPDVGEPVHLDRGMWEKVVLNLLSNAVKFTFTGSIEVSLRRPADDPEHVVLRVADTGTGIPEAELSRLFERFHRVQGARSRGVEGSGIGLALVHEIVGLHGGRVSVRSTVDVGTEFLVELPMGTAHLPTDRIVAPGDVSDPGTDVEPLVAEALGRLPGTDGPGSAADEIPMMLARPAAEPAGRVLVADDDADMRDYLGKLLATHYEVQTVGDGRAALQVASIDPPDLIVSDVMMPELDGLQLVAALRADERTMRVPVLLLSARAGEEAAVEGLAAGADDYLVTPFSARELLARVAAHLRLSRARRDAERRFAAMADLAPGLIWVADTAGRRVYVNQGYTRFTGVPATGAVDDLWVGGLHPEDTAGYLEAYAGDVAAGRAWRCEYRLRGADGNYRWVVENAVPIGDGSGFVASAVDVNARYREGERQSLLAGLGAALDAAETEMAGTDAAGGDSGFAAAARLIVELRLADRCSVRLLEPGADLDAGPDLWRVAGAAGDPAADPTTVHRMPEPARPVVVTEPAPGMALPLRARGRVRGVLVLGRVAGSATYDDDDVVLVTEVAARIGIALDNALLLAEERATSHRLDLLHRATAELSAAATPEQVVEVTRRHVSRLLATPAVGVWERREDPAEAGDTLRAGVLDGWDALFARDWASVPVGGSAPVADAVRERRVVLLERPADWERAYPHLVDVVGASGYRSLAVWPLVVGDESLGALAVGFARPRTLGIAELATALALVEQCAQALQRARLLRAESDARRAAVRLGAALAALSAATDLAGVTRAVLDQLTVLGAVAAVVAVRDEDHLTVLATTGYPAGGPSRLAAAGTLVDAANRGEPLWSADGPDRWGAPANDPYPVQAALPLMVAGGCIGAIGLRWAGGPPGADARLLLLTLVGQCAQALDRARLQQAEHEVAVTLQRVLLPGATPALERLAVATRYLPGAAGTVAGGDWYDVIPLADGRVAIVVGDVVGQGPRAAAVMGQLRSALAAYLIDDNEPAQALERLDRFARRVTGAAASTVACMILDRETGELRWARAGHVPALVVDADGGRFLLAGGGTVLGVSGRPPFTEERIVLEPGACVLLYTDGLVERRGESIDEGLDRLVVAAADLRDRDPERLATELLVRCLGDGPADDVALVVIRLLPAPLQGSRNADPVELAGLRREVRAWARDAGLHPDQLDDLQLAVGEAVANAVEHAYRGGAIGDVRFSLSVGPDGGVAVEVGDTGRWRPPPADPGHRGRGLLVIDRIGQGFAVEGSDEGTVVRFVVPPTPSGAGGGSGAVRMAPPGGGHRPARLVRRTTVAGVEHLDLTGDLDMLGVRAVRGPLLAAVVAGPAVLDVSGVQYVSSAGVALLLEATDLAATGAALQIRAAPGSAADRVLRITGLVR